MGGKRLRGLGGAGGEGTGKAMGKGHRAGDLAQRMRTRLGLPSKSGFLIEKTQFGVKKESFVETT